VAFADGIVLRGVLVVAAADCGDAMPLLRGAVEW
jgi:hypothetical protein